MAHLFLIKVNPLGSWPAYQILTAPTKRLLDASVLNQKHGQLCRGSRNRELEGLEISSTRTFRESRKEDANVDARTEKNLAQLRRFREEKREP